MRTVTSIVFAATAGICLALFLFALDVGGVTWIVPTVALGLCSGLVVSSLYMAGKAGTPGCLPIAVFGLVAGLMLLLIVAGGV